MVMTYKNKFNKKYGFTGFKKSMQGKPEKDESHTINEISRILKNPYRAGP
jgi:hypothetical protein